LGILREAEACDPLFQSLLAAAMQNLVQGTLCLTLALATAVAGEWLGGSLLSTSPGRACQEAVLLQRTTSMNKAGVLTADSEGEVNWYYYDGSVGGWGGTCTCPNGETYDVGDNGDACASLACVGGTEGQCFEEQRPERNGMKVECNVAPPALSPAALRVLSYNVWWWCNPSSRGGCQPTTDYASLAGMHAYWKSLPRTSLVGVQECDGGWPVLKSYLAGTVDYLREVRVEPDGPLCTLYDPARFDFIASGRRNVWSYRYLEYVRLQDKLFGKTVFFVNTHWDHQGQDTTGHASSTEQAIKEHSQPDDIVIVVGDFNVPPWVHVFPDIFEGRLGLHLDGRGSSHAQIDMIWTNHNGDSQCSSPEDSGPAGTGSDHNPVYCEFGVDSSSLGPSPTTKATTTMNPSTTTSVAQATPAPAPLPGSETQWEYHPRMNCFRGRGADSIDGKDPIEGITLTECMNQCKADPICEGFVMLAAQDPGLCWLRRDITFSDCIEYPEYDVWILLPMPLPVPSSMPGLPQQTPSPSGTDIFEVVDGGLNKACRGANPADNSNKYFTLHEGVASLDACKTMCIGEAACKGIEYQSSGKRCELWTRSGGIAATTSVSGFICLRYVLAGDPTGSINPFEAVNGGENKACRGANSTDNSNTYFTVSGAPSLDACKVKCLNEAACKGIEYRSSGKRCEVWTRSAGIGATESVSGFTCLRYVPTP